MSLPLIGSRNIANSLYSILNTSLAIDEFDELYITGTLRLKSDNTTKDSFWVGKVNTDGDFIWNYRYVAPWWKDLHLLLLQVCYRYFW